MPRTTYQALHDQLDAQSDQFDEIFAAMDNNEGYQGSDAHEALHEEPIDITCRTRVTVLLTAGGPLVELVADIEQDGTIHNAEFVGYWGFERIAHPVEPETGLHRAMRSYIEGFMF